MIDLSPRTEALAQRMALAKRVGVDDIVRGALEDKARADGLTLEADAPRDSSPEAKAARIARFEQITEAVAALPVFDHRPVREIIDELNEL